MRVCLVALALFISGCMTQSNQPHAPSTGEEGIILDPERPQAVVLVFGSRQSLTAGDRMDAFIVPPKTRALVVDQSYGVRYVRILEGRFAGRTGYITKDFIREQEPVR